MQQFGCFAVPLPAQLAGACELRRHHERRWISQRGVRGIGSGRRAITVKVALSDHQQRRCGDEADDDPRGRSIRSDAGTGLSGRLSTRSGEGLLRRPHWRSLRRLAGSVDVDPLRIPLDRHQQTGLGGGQLPGPGHAFPDREGIRRSPRQTGFSRPAPRFAVPRISPPRAAGLDAPPSPRGAARPPIQSPEGRPSSSHPARAIGGRVRPVESVWIVEIGVVRDRPIVDSPGTPA